MLCHCTVCQRFNSAEFGDTLVLRLKDLVGPVPESVSFDTYRPPPNIQRGVCKGCKQPAFELFRSPILPDIAMIPLAMHRDVESVPEPVSHLFYEHRCREFDDNVPKYQGYLRSQLAFGKSLLGSFGS